MEGLLYILVIACVFLGAGAGCANDSALKPSLYAAAAQTTITPPAGTFLIGPMADSSGVHDELFARVLVLSDGQTQAAIITTDLLGLDFDTNDAILAEVEKVAGISADHIMLNCSHNHSSPLSIPWMKPAEPMDVAWRAALPGKIAHLVNSAIQNMHPAELRYGRQPVRIGFNRRKLVDGTIQMTPNPDGADVPWVDVLCVNRLEGSPLAVLMSYAAHPVIVHNDSTLITAEYPGFAVEQVKKQLANEVVVMFAQGCGGNINAEPWMGGLKKAQLAGRTLADAALKVVHGASCPLPPGRLLCLSRKMSLPFQSPPPADEIERILAEYEKKVQRDPDDYLNQAHVRNLRELLHMARHPQDRSLEFRISIFSIGRELGFVGMSHEMFAEYQLWIDQQASFEHTMVFAYTNGCESYIGMENDYALGGYETGSFPYVFSSAMAYHNHVTLDPSAEQRIKKELGELLLNWP